MRTLFLDLLSQNGLLTCLDGDKVASSKVLDGRMGDHELPSLLLETVTGAAWDIEQVQRIACVTGPGGFTSQRVAVTFANTLAWGLRIPSAGIHLCDLWAARTTQKNFTWAHSTKRDLLFVRGFGSDAKRWPEATAAEVASVVSAAPASFTGELLPEHAAALEAQGGKRVSVVPVLDVLPRVLDSLSYGTVPLEPWYGRGI